jgi:hypothetical protein
MSDYERSKRFYTTTACSGGFDPHRVGLDHVALACGSEAELERVTAALKEAGVGEADCAPSAQRPPHVFDQLG